LIPGMGRTLLHAVKPRLGERTSQPLIARMVQGLYYLGLVTRTSSCLPRVLHAQAHPILIDLPILRPVYLVKNENYEVLLWFEILTAVAMKRTFFWGRAPCRLVEIYRSLGRTNCQHYQSRRLSQSKKPARGAVGFCLVPAYISFGPDDRGSILLRNIGELVPDCTASHPRRQYPSHIVILILSFHPSRVCCNDFASVKLKLNSVALVRERTIPTERPPLIGEVSANFCG
jgi:hypothetical protein